MKCWKCGMDNADGAALCVYCGAAQQRSAPVSEIGKALRTLYDRYGCREVLTQSPYLVSGLGDLATDVQKERNLLKTALDAGIGRCYLEQLERSGKPDQAFYTRVRTLLTEDAGLGEKAAASISGWFDEMIGWTAPAAQPQKTPAPVQTSAPKDTPRPEQMRRTPVSYDEPKKKPKTALFIILAAVVVLAAVIFAVTGGFGSLSGAKVTAAPTNYPLSTAELSYSTPTPTATPLPTETPVTEPYWGRNIVSIFAYNDAVIGVKENGFTRFAGKEPFVGMTDNILDLWTDVVQASINGWDAMVLTSSGTVLDTDGDVVDQDIMQMSAGLYTILGTKKDGTAAVLSAMHTDNNDPADWAVEGWTNLKMIDAGFRHSVGLKKDGTVIACGENDSGQCDVSGWKNIVYIAAGGDTTVGVKSDGTVLCTSTSLSWSSITKVAVSPARGGHIVGLRSDGTVVADGYNADGQCDVSGWRNVVDISAGKTFTLGLQSDGTVLIAGSGEKADLSEVTGW